MNKYIRVARIYPALLTGVSIVLVSIPLVNTLLEIVGANQWIARLVGNIGFSAVILYFYSQLVRASGKFLFEKLLFKNELYFPTTELLLPTNEILSNELKQQIYSAILRDFRIDLTADCDDHELRRKINDSVSQVRLAVGSGRLLLQHNIEYGFIRNVCGGSIFGLGFSLIGLGLGWNNAVMFQVYLVLSIVYVSVLGFSRSLIAHYGFQYGKVLLNEYLNMGYRNA